MVRESDSQSKGCEFESRFGINCRWGEWMSSLNVSPPSIPLTEVPLSKAPNLQLLPGCRSINGCPLLPVCVHCWVCAHWMGKCRARMQSLGHHIWLYVTSLSYLLMWLYIPQFDFISHSCNFTSDSVMLYFTIWLYISHLQLYIWQRDVISHNLTLYLTVVMLYPTI